MILSLSLSEHGFPPCQLVCAIANKKPAIWGRMERTHFYPLSLFLILNSHFFPHCSLIPSSSIPYESVTCQLLPIPFFGVLSLYPIALNREDNVSHCKFKPLFFRWPSTVSTAMCRRFKGTNLRVEQQ